jgi:hypothetical protein
MAGMANETTKAPKAPEAQASANGTAPGPDGPPAAGVIPPVVGGTERMMFAVMLAAGLGLLCLAVDGLSGYALSRALSRALFQPRGDDDS